MAGKGLIPILMYHGIHDRPGEGGSFEPVYSITRREFGAQLQWLADNGYRTATCRQMEDLAADGKHVIITFDDGDLSNRTVSLEMLQRHSMCAEYFITSDWIGTPGYMSATQLMELEGAGMSVQSHARSHRFLSELDDQEIREELAGSKRTLERILGRPVTGLALPGGRGDRRVVRVAREVGYRYLCNSELGLNSPGCDPFSLRRIPITRGMDLDTFRRLVTGDRWEMGRRRARQLVLAGLKRVLGNRLYVRLRSGVVE